MSYTQHNNTVAKREDRFYQDVVDGLRSPKKRLPSKYFYDTQGDRLFQQIMACPEYYLTRAELSIFKDDTASLAEPILSLDQPFDLIELGAGDGTKTAHLLEFLLKQGVDFRYCPIDISAHILSELENRLSTDLPRLEVETVAGDYFDGLSKVIAQSSRIKVVLFLGSTIGNMPPEDAMAFLKTLRGQLRPGDMALIGFDLQKNPQIILDAYSDKAGFTRDFNLNLLKRMNRELNANFKVGQFSHYQMYDPDSGSCRSYLVSLVDQSVDIRGERFVFGEGEPIHTETSQNTAWATYARWPRLVAFKAFAN